MFIKHMAPSSQPALDSSGPHVLQASSCNGKLENLLGSFEEEKNVSERVFLMAQWDPSFSKRFTSCRQRLKHHPAAELEQHPQLHKFLTWQPGRRAARDCPIVFFGAVA